MEETRTTNAETVIQDKIYRLTSSKGTVAGLLNGRTSSVVTLKEDGMTIITSPKRLNNLPEINYKDIMSVTMSVKMSWYFIFLAVFTCITVILPILCIWMGMNQKIVITLNNGIQTTMYSSSKSMAEQFVNDLNMRRASAKI